MSEKQTGKNKEADQSPQARRRFGGSGTTCACLPSSWSKDPSAMLQRPCQTWANRTATETLPLSCPAQFKNKN